MNENYMKIENSNSLLRNTDTGAIINSDTNEYQNYLNNYERLKKQQQEFENLKDTVNTLSSDIGDIKNLLTTLIRSTNNDD
jgi:hypothetical protein